MTLPEIASELDKLIQRLQTARTLLASLGPDADLPLAAAAHTPRPSRRRRIPSSTEIVQPEPAAPSLPAEPAVQAPAPSARSHRRKRMTIPSSLSGKVPAGPVAVPAAEIRRRFATAEPAPAPAQAEPPRGNSLDDLLRELAQRPLTSVAL